MILVIVLCCMSQRARPAPFKVEARDGGVMVTGTEEEHRQIQKIRDALNYGFEGKGCQSDWNCQWMVSECGYDGSCHLSEWKIAGIVVGMIVLLCACGGCAGAANQSR